MNYESLSNELKDAAYAELSDSAAAESLNAVTVTCRQLVPLWQVKKHALENGYWLLIKAAALDTQHPAYAAAASAVEFVSDTRFENLDMDLVSTKAMIAGLVATSVMTAAQAEALDAMADYSVSRAAQLGLSLVSTDDVGIARGTRSLVQR